MSSAASRARSRARTLRKKGDLAGARLALETALEGASPVDRAALEADLGELRVEAEETVTSAIEAPFLDQGLLAKDLEEKPAARVEPPDADGIAGVSAAIVELRRTIVRAAKSDAPVLVTGGSGAGKELVARAVHRRSARASEPFVALAAGGFTQGMVEDELFGHVAGAFTGAASARTGLLVEAGRGTLLLDGVDDMPLEVQAKLLRVLENGEARPLGGGVPVKIEARILATARKPLGPLVREGAFREDLLYRLSVLTIAVPPLRERPEDVPSLVAALLSRHAKSAAPRVAPGAMARLEKHAWPGNVRELENELRRLLVVGADPIQESSLSAAIRRGKAAPGGELSTGLYEKLRGKTLEDVERAAILSALKTARGNRSQAARLLNLPRRTLYDMMKRLGIDAKEWKG